MFDKLFWLDSVLARKLIDRLQACVDIGQRLGVDDDMILVVA